MTLIRKIASMIRARRIDTKQRTAIPDQRPRGSTILIDDRPLRNTSNIVPAEVPDGQRIGPKETEQEQTSPAGTEALSQPTSTTSKLAKTASSTSVRKAESNRRNAKSSTGPKTARGKLTVRGNALR